MAHRAYTDLSAARDGAGTMHSLQPCQNGNDSLLNMILYPLLDNAWRALPCKALGNSRRIFSG